MKTSLLPALAFPFLLLATALHAQHPVLNTWHSRNAFIAEAGGRGIWYSFSYERRWALDDRLHVQAQIGVAPVVQTLIVPVGITFSYGPRRHHLEGGMGITGFFPSEVTSGPVIRPRLGRWVASPDHIYLGYRYLAPEGGLVLRAGVYALFGQLTDIYVPSLLSEGSFHPWAGFSIGYALKNIQVK